MAFRGKTLIKSRYTVQHKLRRQRAPCAAPSTGGSQAARGGEDPGNVFCVPCKRKSDSPELHTGPGSEVRLQAQLGQRLCFIVRRRPAGSWAWGRQRFPRGPRARSLPWKHNRGGQAFSRPLRRLPQVWAPSREVQVTRDKPFCLAACSPRHFRAQWTALSSTQPLAKGPYWGLKKWPLWNEVCWQAKGNSKKSELKVRSCEMSQ